MSRSKAVRALADADVEVTLAGCLEVGLVAPDAESERQRVRRPEQEGVRAGASLVGGDHDRSWGFGVSLPK